MRLFAAVRPEGLSRAVLEQVQGELRHRGRGAFPHPSGLHLTLAFLGQTERVDAARSALETLALSGRFSLTAEGLGRFGDTWWAGTAPCPALETLAASARRALEEAGFSLEKRPFVPHITLARHYRPRNTAAVTVPPVTWEVGKIELLASCPASPGSPRYRCIHSVRL